VERFNRTALDEFFTEAFGKKLYESVEALQQDMNGSITTITSALIRATAI